MKSRAVIIILTIFGIVLVGGCISKESQTDIFSNIPLFGEENQSQTQISRGEQSVLAEECKKYPLPPDCSIVPEQERRLFCERCKQIFPQESTATPWQQAEQPEGGRQKTTLDLPSCGSKNEFFNTAPISLSQITTITPLGNLNPSGHTFPTDHNYFNIIKVGGSLTAEVPLYSPSGATVTRIDFSEHLSESPPFTDYNIHLSSCKEVRIRFAHVSSLSEKLKTALTAPYNNCNEYTTGGNSYRYCSKNVDIAVEAGEQIGTAGGREQSGLDVWAYDDRTSPLQYANPNRWYEDQKHIVCAIDYFTPEIKSAMQAKLGGWDGTKRKIQPVCGEIEQDEAGTAQGVWFVEGTAQTYPEDPHLALVHDNIDPAKGVFSAGTSISGLPSGTYYFSPVGSGFVNRDFKDVIADGNFYCFEAAGGKPYTQHVAIILQLTTPATLRIEKQNSNACGSGPWAFGPNYADFER